MGGGRLTRLMYRDRDTPVHRIPTAPKVAFVISAFLAFMVLDGLIPSLLLLAITVYILGRAGCLRDWAFLARIMAALSLLVVISNVLFTRMGGTVYWQYGPVPLLGTMDITSEELLFSLAAAVRLLGVMSVFLILTLTVQPDDLFGMVSRRFPALTGLLFSLTAIMYPSMVRDASGVADAHRSRGLEMDSGPVLRRARARMPIIRPVFANAMERSMDLGEAMAARGWGRKAGGGNGKAGGMGTRAPSAVPYPGGPGGKPPPGPNTHRAVGARGPAGKVRGPARTLLYAASGALVFLCVLEVVTLVVEPGASILRGSPALFLRSLTNLTAGGSSTIPGSLTAVTPFLFLAACILAAAAPSATARPAGAGPADGNGGTGRSSTRRGDGVDGVVKAGASRPLRAAGPEPGGGGESV